MLSTVFRLFRQIFVFLCFWPQNSAPPRATCVTCAVKRRRACHFAPSTATCVTCAVKRRHFTNQIQREFSSNVAIPTQNTVLASSPPRQKTNLLKLGVLSLCAVKRRRAVNLAAVAPSPSEAFGEACCHFAPPKGSG
jgi:hypothetical protein